MHRFQLSLLPSSFVHDCWRRRNLGGFEASLETVRLVRSHPAVALAVTIQMQPPNRNPELEVGTAETPTGRQDHQPTTALAHIQPSLLFVCPDSWNALPPFGCNALLSSPQVTFGPNLEAETEVNVQFSGEEVYGKVSRFCSLRGRQCRVRGMLSRTLWPRKSPGNTLGCSRVTRKAESYD